MDLQRPSVYLLRWQIFGGNTGQRLARKMSRRFKTPPWNYLRGWTKRDVCLFGIFLSLFYPLLSAWMDYGSKLLSLKANRDAPNELNWVCRRQGLLQLHWNMMDSDGLAGFAFKAGDLQMFWDSAEWELTTDHWRNRELARVQKESQKMNYSCFHLRSDGLRWIGIDFPRRGAGGGVHKLSSWPVGGEEWVLCAGAELAVDRRGGCRAVRPVQSWQREGQHAPCERYWGWWGRLRSFSWDNMEWGAGQYERDWAWTAHPDSRWVVTSGRSPDQVHC